MKQYSQVHEKIANLGNKPQVVPPTQNTVPKPTSTTSIKDVKIGTGDAVRVGNAITYSIVKARIAGKEYADPQSRSEINYFSNKTAIVSVENSVLYDAYLLNIVGMKKGGVREITFSPDKSFWFSTAEADIVIEPGMKITYTIELHELK